MLPTLHSNILVNNALFFYRFNSFLPTDSEKEPIILFLFLRLSNIDTAVLIYHFQTVRYYKTGRNTISVYTFLLSLFQVILAKKRKLNIKLPFQNEQNDFSHLFFYKINFGFFLE